MREIDFMVWDKECKIMRSFDEFMNVSVASLFENDNFVLLQDTGLKDKNGVKIFEGYIIKTHYANAIKADFIEKVVFKEGGFKSEYKISDTGKMWASLANGIKHLAIDKSVYMENCEVIGNIYENGDLLE